MAARKFANSAARYSQPASFPDSQIYKCGVPFKSEKALIAAKSAKIAHLLKEHPHRDVSTLLKDLHVDQEAFELVLSFCHGLEPTLTPENVVSILCLAHYLGMTESHCQNNLLKRALTYFEVKILPRWDESVKALKSSESVLQQADRIGLVDTCFESLISKALANPRLVGEPIMDMVIDDDGEKENWYAPSAKRRLFDPDQSQRKELTILCIQLYEPLIREMISQFVPLEYILGSVCRYAKAWVYARDSRKENSLPYELNNQRAVIEAIERLLPDKTKGLIPCTLLFKMLRSAIVLEANPDCKNGLETRIGKQLENAMVKDLLIPSCGYAKEAEYDFECVRRIMKNFYNNYNHPDGLALISVAELMDDFLAEVASEIDLKPTTFVTLAEMTVSASVGTHRSSDGIYRAIDTFLTSHKHLTESEREEVCRVLDCYTMTVKAREHAVQNDRLPIRVVVQVLFVGQLHLKDTIGKDFGDKVGDEEEIEKMGSKVMKLEREYHVMRKKTEGDKGKKEKMSVWREMKRKLGCYNGKIEEEQIFIKKKKKKVHPRH